MKKEANSFPITVKEGRAIFLTLLVLLGAFLIFNHLSVSFARAWDIQWGYYATLATFVALIVGVVANAKELVSRVRSHCPSRKSLAVLFGLLIFFTIFSVNHIENSHRVLSDETSWESMGLQMYFEQSGGICNEGIWKDGVLDCRVEVNNFKGKALGFVYSLVFLFADPNRDTALLVNLPFYLMSLVAFFLALSIWLKSDWRALAATAFLGGMPILLMQSRSASTEVLYIFLLAFLMAWYALVPPKEVKWKHFLLTVPLLGLFSGTRQETVFAFAPFAIYYFRYFRAEFYRLPLFVLSVVAVCWPAVNTMAAYRGYDFQGGTHAAHSLSNFWFNLKTDTVRMLNLGSDSARGDILENPFYTTFTVILLLATLWLLYRMIFQKRYRRGFVLGFLFCIQIFVILLNVSGTFEIDINQRYVLVALPLFALIMALGVSDFLEVRLQNFKRSSQVAALIAVALSTGLALWHTSSFEANMLYYKNKLLGEENYLNSYLKKFPENSIFIYARPWQMLASGHSSFSERTFMGWGTDEFAKYQAESGGNIYLVRGQDGYGQVNRQSRVVGFKTTDQINSILEGYKVEKVLVENRLFGYPLTVHRVVAKHGLSLYAQGISVGEMQLEDGRGVFALSKNFPESVAYHVWRGNDLLTEGVLDSSPDSLTISDLPAGLSRYSFAFYVPDDTVRIIRDAFVDADDVALLSTLPMVEFEQDWGEPQMDESVEHHTLRINGESFRFGIGSHANSRLLFSLPKDFEMLHAVVGLDDESACGDGAEFAVWTDGKPVWRSRRIYSGESLPIQVKIRGVRSLELRLDRGGDKNCDHGDWANAWLSGGK
ncbi:NPCBM/NEW2 domain-containing protein [Fibrobacter intestinalis]|uniref:NPCBM/NEW2 domain-containing protein n=1 Tax=Fibrobacter intestinalis TaxID=28122 RepID=A0A1M6UJQ8_9BACT|nr:NPCBM/NEW2 domain-containing protein [Fibrobacter intestinalis]SHK69421.1 NPCBM/NEW2 domain-containing protein [Fibrobacter intestinalis]